MKKLVLFVLALMLVLAAAGHRGKRTVEKSAGTHHADVAEGITRQSATRERVEYVLAGMRPGRREIDEQVSITMWARGQLVATDRDQLRAEYDGYLRWKMVKGLGDTIESGTVDAIDLFGPVPIASVTIDGSPYRLSVPPGGAIGWVE